MQERLNPLRDDSVVAAFHMDDIRQAMLKCLDE